MTKILRAHKFLLCFCTDLLILFRQIGFIINMEGITHITLFMLCVFLSILWVNFQNKVKLHWVSYELGLKIDWYGTKWKWSWNFQKISGRHSMKAFIDQRFAAWRWNTDRRKNRYYVSLTFLLWCIDCKYLIQMKEGKYVFVKMFGFHEPLVVRNHVVVESNSLCHSCTPIPSLQSNTMSFFGGSGNIAHPGWQNDGGTRRREKIQLQTWCMISRQKVDSKRRCVSSIEVWGCFRFSVEVRDLCNSGLLNISVSTASTTTILWVVTNASSSLQQTAVSNFVSVSELYCSRL
jgi:hypothetical protein